jgi:hypothetical protein
VPTIGLLGDHRVDEIPASHRDLVQCPPVAALTTVMVDGSPQISVVWCDFDGDCVRVTPCGALPKSATCAPTHRSPCCATTPTSPTATWRSAARSWR